MAGKTDIWMPLYIGDYLADTGHLDAERSGCYLHWLMHYWRKGPLPNDTEQLINIGKLRSENAPSIVEELLKDFFTREADQFWRQKRLDSELAQWGDKRRRAKEKAVKAGSSRWKRGDASSIAQAVLDVCPSPSPSTAQEKTNAKALARSVPPEDLAGTLPLVDGTLHEVSKQQVREWSQAFPAVDVRSRQTGSREP